MEWFRASLKSRSPANMWFRTLHVNYKATWKAIKAAFKIKWPEKAVTEMTAEKKTEMLMAEKLLESELGRKVKVGGIEEYTHVVWADRVERLANNFPDS